MKITTVLLCILFFAACSNYGDKSAANVDSINTGDTPRVDVNNGSAVVPTVTNPVTDTTVMPVDSMQHP